jgi:hypothetical protein
LSWLFDIAAWLAADFFLEQPVNILAWGSMSSGKSSFINGIINLFRGRQQLQENLTTYRSDKHVTKNYSKHSIADYLDNEVEVEHLISQKLKLNLWDPWGITDQNYKLVSVQHFIEGRIAEHTNMEKEEVGLVPPNPAHRIHAVIIIIPIGVGQDSEMLDLLRKHITIILEETRTIL